MTTAINAMVVITPGRVSENQGCNGFEPVNVSLHAGGNIPNRANFEYFASVERGDYEPQRIAMAAKCSKQDRRRAPDGRHL